MLRIESLSKSFGLKTALSDISMTAHNGRITALVGANGAGKSTLIGIVCGYHHADAGKVEKGSISVMPDADNLYREMSGRQFLSFISRVKGAGDTTGHWRALARRLGISGHLSKKIKSYSFGMKKKISFIQACIGQYDTYIFDEPTSGVDVHSGIIMMQIIGELKTQGAAVLLTSHNMDELERISDYVYFIDRGAIAQSGTVSEITTHPQAETGQVQYMVEVDSDHRPALVTLMTDGTIAGPLKVEPAGRGLLVTVPESLEVSTLLKDILNQNEPITGFWRQNVTLEQALFET